MATTLSDSETPAHGQQVIVACAFIRQKFDGTEKVLMAKRAATKKFYPKVYEVPGGHVEFGEDIVAGLKREIQEELHVDIEVGDPFAAFTYHNQVKGSHSVEIVFFARLASPLDAVRLNPEDHSAYSWFSEDQFAEFTEDRDDPDDPEPLAVMRGFALLRGEEFSP